MVPAVWHTLNTLQYQLKGMVLLYLIRASGRCLHGLMTFLIWSDFIDVPLSNLVNQDRKLTTKYD